MIEAEDEKRSMIRSGAATPSNPPYLVDPGFAALPWLVHGFGTRAWGPEDFGAGGGWPGARLVELEQTHSDVVRFIDKPPARRPRGDALATDKPGLILAIRTADCLPVLLADAEHKAVAAVHAGWRGTSLGILAGAVRALGERYGSRPSRLAAVLGPCIGPACYEVGEDVRGEFLRRGLGDAAFRKRAGRNADGRAKYLLDLRAANRSQLLRAGLRPQAVTDIALCTHCDGRLLSYRRDRDTSARLYNFIGVRKSVSVT
jgi:YfiH family protein